MKRIKSLITWGLEFFLSRDFLGFTKRLKADYQKKNQNRPGGRQNSYIHPPLKRNHNLGDNRCQVGNKDFDSPSAVMRWHITFLCQNDLLSETEYLLLCNRRSRVIYCTQYSGFKQKSFVTLRTRKISK